MSDKPLLQVKNLQTHFFTASGVAKAVDGVTFSLDSGETLGIVGESGSGKSVTSNSIMRLLPKNGKIVGGEILFEDKDIAKLKLSDMLDIRGQDISMIFQDPMTALDPVFTIGSQIMEVINAHQKLSKKEARDYAIKVLGMVGIPDPEKRLKSYPHEFSGGMRQRVIIAMAIACHPKLIIADEPTTALDVTVQAQVLNLLKDLQKETGTAIILVTHNLGVVWRMCDTVMVMYAGKTVEYADVKTLYQDPRHPYTWGLLKSMPKITDDPNVPLASIPGTPPDLKLTGGSCNFHNRCKYCQEICMKQSPEMKEVEPGHFVACHFSKEELDKIGGSLDA
ncbi:MAG: ABC transporter ATP-binding protein [Clostridiales bacterium]|nr:ABC transporter ATP-binding protein [Clostridiales bacterium]